jgi:rod shape-determining protein MreC
MRHIPIEPPAFFNRGPSPIARLAFFGMLSIALLFVDTRYHYLEGVRRVAAIVLYPVQRAAQLPTELLSDAGNYFASLHALTDENLTLKRSLVERAAAAQGNAAAQQENARLRKLIELGSRHAAGTTAVEVLYASRDPFAQKLYVGKGVDAELRPGEAVIDAEGVVGQVTRVFPSMAEVTLVTDKDHAVPVKVQRSGVRSVLYGAGAGHAPELRFMAPSADIQVGDVLVTSGLDGTYPAGLAVARVATLDRETGQMFARITCTPMAGVDRSEHLLVLARSAVLPPRPEEPAESDMAKKQGKGRRKGGGTP